MSIGDSGNSDNPQFERELSADEPHNEIPDPSILDRVIEKTVSSDGLTESLPAEELAELLEVARRHRSRPLELEPVVVDLVNTIVRQRFKLPGMDPQRSDAMARELAESLFRSPHSRQRLDSFWSKLLEAVS